MPRPDPPAEHRFRPGQSGNPGGRPKGKPLTRALRRLLRDGGAEDIARAIVDAVKAGSSQHASLLFDRIEGKVPAPVEVSGAAGGPLMVTVEYVDKPLDDFGEDPTPAAPREPTEGAGRG